MTQLHQWLSPSFLPLAAAGGVLALPYVWAARRARRPARPVAIGLFVAALVYLLSAGLVGASLGHTVLELFGVAVFGVIAVAGALRWPVLLAMGWAVHVAWDVLLHPAHEAGYAPWWYPALCTGFDFVVAAFVLVNWRQWSARAA